MAKPAHLNQYIVGAYTTSPNLFSWDEPSEGEYFAAIRKIRAIRGLELPFWGKSLHPVDDDWLLSNLDPAWENVLTCLPGTMVILADNIHFGLASRDENSRKSAIQFYRIALKSIQKLKARNGEDSLHAIHLASSPRNLGDQQLASAESFEKSLDEILEWDWGNTKLVVEHCDAWSAKNDNPQKGFLQIEEEVDAIISVNAKHGSDIGMIINWGRSVIESQSIAGASQQIELVDQHNLLHGLMFSGTTDNDANLYGKWSDLHMPPAPYLKHQYGEAESLMTHSAIEESLRKCDFNKLGYVGIKLLAMPDDSPLEKRIGINVEALAMIEDIMKELR
jgi:hypothetical protein